MSRLTGLLIGAARTGVGAAFAVNPTQSMRLLGVDTATAHRLRWLAQMAAARDIALGVGTVVATVRRQGSGSWLLAGAACDAADAGAIALAVSRKQVAPLAAAAVITVALAGCAAALGIVLDERRQPIDTLVT
jgi:hypothetical protein